MCFVLKRVTLLVAKRLHWGSLTALELCARNILSCQSMGSKSEAHGFFSICHIREWQFQDSDYLLMVSTLLVLHFLDSEKERSRLVVIASGTLKNKQKQNKSSFNPQWWSFFQVSVAGSGTGRGSPAVTLVQLPSGQTVQVQGVIQTPHPSVIQSPQIQTVQVSVLPWRFVFDFLEL